MCEKKEAKKSKEHSWLALFDAALKMSWVDSKRQYAMGSTQWAVRNGQYAMGSTQWAIRNGHAFTALAFAQLLCFAH